MGVKTVKKGFFCQGMFGVPSLLRVSNRLGYGSSCGDRWPYFCPIDDSQTRVDLKSRFCLPFSEPIGFGVELRKIDGTNFVESDAVVIVCCCLP